MTNESNYYVLKTLGCKSNIYDSQLIEAELRRRGWCPFEPDADSRCLGVPKLCIVNSCTVTDEADRQTRKLASRLSRENPQARVVVTGCGAEIDPERLARSVGIHYVVGNQDKPRMVELILEKMNQQDNSTSGEILGAVSGYSEMTSRHPLDREWPSVEASFVTPPVGLDGHAGKTRAFLKIQEGCNSFCTYCIIPYGRGPARSLKPREVLSQVLILVNEGVREIVITGTNVGDYGVDWGMDPQTALAELFALILDESPLERLRVGSLDPTEITPALLKLMAKNPRLCPHFHVSLQATDGAILRRMKRKYGPVEVRECLKQIASLNMLPGGVFVGMDLIAGFPGEQTTDFEVTLAALSELEWSRLHVFPYSEREGTPATRLPGSVSHQERMRRSKKLGELSFARIQRHYERALEQCKMSSKGLLKGVLFERPMDRVPEAWSTGEQGVIWANGYTANYLRVVIPLPRDRAQELRNQILDVVPTSVLIDAAAGEAVFLARLP
ncbi:tRNA (N(6)-L-threonylcarbamoyladenosine(37)-C(2))-methylthiotransferase MtaB [Bdellovibrionota bacterium FG-1]